MKFKFFIFLFLILSINGVLATGFSPSSLIFNLEQGQEDCKTISINSDSPIISVTDKWAENKDVEWKVSLFEEDASYHEIDINYESEIIINENNKSEVEICVSGNKVGEYHGVILLREEQEGNSVVQMGVWIKLIISEQDNQQTTTTSSSSSSSSSSGGGSSNSYSDLSLNESSVNITTQTISSQEENTQNSVEKEDNQEDLESSGITGSAVGENNTKRNWGILGFSFIAIFAIAIIIYRRRN